MRRHYRFEVRRESARFLLVAVALLAAACARAGTPPGSGVEDTGGQPVIELSASCGAVRFSDLPPQTSTYMPFSSWNEIDLGQLEGEAPFFTTFVARYSWFVTDEIATTRVLFGEPIGSAESGAPHAYADLELREGEWVPRGWGECRIKLIAEGWGNARFTLDPQVRPDPRSRTLSVLATETNCAGGLPPEGREVRGVVLEETEETVSVLILVEPLGGDCPSNPSFEFDVELPSPLGDRRVLDASVYPPTERQWPPN